MSEITIADPGHPGMAPLIGGLATEYRSRYGELADGELDSVGPAEFRPPTGALLLLVQDDETLAGGAVRRWSDGIAEIKRMWTAPAHRRRGHGRRILAALEDVARGYGYRSVRLQTGDLQPGALALYAAAGYQRIPRYGRYADEPRCVSFEKSLS